MERREARRLLEESTDFKFEGDKVILRDVRIIAAVEASAREAGDSMEYLRTGLSGSDAHLTA